jgi:hypothetical protein
LLEAVIQCWMKFYVAHSESPLQGYKTAE